MQAADPQQMDRRRLRDAKRSTFGRTAPIKRATLVETLLWLGTVQVGVMHASDLYLRAGWQAEFSTRFGEGNFLMADPVEVKLF